MTLQITINNENFNVPEDLFNKYKPNYFTEIIEDQINKNNNESNNITVQLNRDVDNFKSILLILQDYNINSLINSKINTVDKFLLFKQDLKYYKLESLLEKIESHTNFYLININGQDFKIAKNLITKHNGYDFPWEQTSYIYNRSSNTFDHLLKLLQESQYSSPSSNVFQFHDTILRRKLINECDFYKFNKLKQQLINCNIKINPCDDSLREIYIHINDIDITGIKIKHGMNQVTNACTTPCSGSSESGSNSKNNACSANITPTCSSSSSENEEDPLQQPQRKKFKKCSTKKTWDILKYSRPILDNDKINELVFQFNENESSLVFNKISKIIHIDITGSNLKLFELKFKEFLSHHSINLNNYKFKFATQKNGNEIEHLILPACTSICDLSINNIQCRNIGQLINETKYTEKIIDFTNMHALSHTSGLVLHLGKSLWKCGIKDGKIMMIGIKADSFTNIKEYNKLVDFI